MFSLIKRPASANRCEEQQAQIAAISDDGRASAVRRVPSQDAYLVVIHGDSLGLCVPLDCAATAIGRISTSDIQIAQDSVSRSHCRVLFDGRRWSIRDLGSTNGTYVNDDLASVAGSP